MADLAPTAPAESIAGRVYTLARRQHIRRSLPDTFGFFERPANLPLITPPWLGFEIVTPEPIAMRKGLVLDYRVRVLGRRIRWRSAITEYDPPTASATCRCGVRTVSGTIATASSSMTVGR